MFGMFDRDYDNSREITARESTGVSVTLIGMGLAIVGAAAAGIGSTLESSTASSDAQITGAVMGAGAIVLCAIGTALRCYATRQEENQAFRV
jgi:drug/metabolite transporter (DMT)-like permease